MRPNTTSSPARRSLRAAERRGRRRPAILAAGLAIGLVAAAGASVTLPTSPAQASISAEGFVLASYSASLQPIVADATVDTSMMDAREALAAAEDSITAAVTVATDIEGSGLDIGVADTTVDTDELESAVTRLELADRLPAELVPAFVDEVTELVAAVEADVNGLRGSLDAAIALKAEQEAAEKAKREAEEAAAAAAAAAEAARAAAAAATPKSSAPSVGSSAPVFAGPGTSAGEAQAIARNMIGGYGWGDDQFNCLVSLWNKESGWNSQAYNASSGAFGIPQALPGSKMASAGADWQTNAATQIAWGLGYISGRYGNPCGAWGHSQSVGWY
ncbi:MAG: aggregation-promoting factor C-terminal-like domain-containing protein [Microbacterium sp.]